MCSFYYIKNEHIKNDRSCFCNSFFYLENEFIELIYIVRESDLCFDEIFFQSNLMFENHIFPFISSVEKSEYCNIFCLTSTILNQILDR